MKLHVEKNKNHYIIPLPMPDKLKITEIKENYTVRARIRGAQTQADGSHFEEKTLTRYKEVITVEGWARFGHFLL
ncbi:hypothetical protein NK983_33200, partial [Salmonella enterica subsp. enterica serovar Typhimurium]|nr:hypothetical protein [Salmonella enterica subsp. enterica serovar Typhimurium]